MIIKRVEVAPVFNPLNLMTQLVIKKMYLCFVKNNEFILTRVKSQIGKIDPEAVIILFGSRARQDFQENSDWDFLILTKQIITRTLKNNISDALFETELETGQVITGIVQSYYMWQNYSEIPIFKNISRDGILI